MVKKKYRFIVKNFPLFLSIFFWFVITFFLLNFVNKLFQSNQDDLIDKERLLIIFLIILSISIFIVVMVYLVKNIISVFRKEFGARMKLKIVLFFIFVALLPTIPFIQIGTKFIESSMNLWFSKNLGVSLDLSEEVIKEYYEEKKNILVNYVSEINEAVKKGNYNFKQLNNYLDEFYVKNNKINKIKNITLWTVKGEVIRQVGDNIFDNAIENNSFELENVRVFLYENKEGIFNIQENDGNFFLIIPAKIFDKEKNLLGFLDIAIMMPPQFGFVTKEIDNALRCYNTASLYKDFFTRGFSILFLTIIFPIILIILVISLFLTRDLLDPIASLSNATRRVAEGDYNFRIESSFNDEFMVLSKSFNSMIGELEISRERLQQKEKIATWQEIARQLAHEIRNPLTPIRLSSERILKKYKEDSGDFEEILQKGIKTIISEVENMDKLLKEFSNISNFPTVEKKKGGIIDIIKEVIELFSVNKNNIELTLVSIKDDYYILRDRFQLRSVFANILKNSIESMKSGGEIQIFLDDKEIGYKKYLVVTIKDQGEGIDIENLQDIFVPYFSTKENGRGLGLSIVQKIVHEHEGRIYFSSNKGIGTSFFVELPIVEKI